MTILLEAKNLSKKFDEYVLFEQLSLQLFSKGSVAIQGRSGEGKSTLLHILSGIEPPSSGQLLFQGKNFQELDLDVIRNRHFGFLFQAFHLLEERDVLANVLLPVEIARWPSPFSKSDWQITAEELLDKIGLHRKKQQKISSLSGGEKQRVALARSLILKPQILFLDEPTGNLDYQTAQEIFSLLFSLLEESLISSMVFVTHDPSFARMADRLFILKERSLHQVS